MKATSKKKVCITKEKLTDWERKRRETSQNHQNCHISVSFFISRPGCALPQRAHGKTSEWIGPPVVALAAALSMMGKRF